MQILIVDQQIRALEAATITLPYFTALCPPMGKTREIFDLHFLAKPGFFQANYCDVTKVEVPNCVLTCNMRNEFVAVSVYQAVKNPATSIPHLIIAILLLILLYYVNCFYLK